VPFDRNFTEADFNNLKQDEPTCFTFVSGMYLVHKQYVSLQSVQRI
jgi:hypothetical protein